MKTSIYIPYINGAGPSKEQAEQNTLALATLLDEKEIPYQKDTEFSQQTYGNDDLNLVLKNGEHTIFVGYDRWGFVADGNADIDIDQTSIETTLKLIESFMESFTY